MDRWFHSKSLLVQVILLLLPVVNWCVEALVRWSSWVKTGGGTKLFVAVFVTIFGLPIALADAIFVILKGKLLFE